MVYCITLAITQSFYTFQHMIIISHLSLCVNHCTIVYHCVYMTLYVYGGNDGYILVVSKDSNDKTCSKLNILCSLFNTSSNVITTTNINITYRMYRIIVFKYFN